MYYFKLKLLILKNQGIWLKLIDCDSLFLSHPLSTILLLVSISLSANGIFKLVNLLQVVHLTYFLPIIQHTELAIIHYHHPSFPEFNYT